MTARTPGRSTFVAFALAAALASAGAAVAAPEALRWMSARAFSKAVAMTLKQPLRKVTLFSSGDVIVVREGQISRSYFSDRLADPPEDLHSCELTAPAALDNLSEIFRGFKFLPVQWPLRQTSNFDMPFAVRFEDRSGRLTTWLFSSPLDLVDASPRRKDVVNASVGRATAFVDHRVVTELFEAAVAQGCWSDMPPLERSYLIPRTVDEQVELEARLKAAAPAVTGSPPR